ncbi:MAG: PIN domain-containing protein [bacterium]
MQIILDSDIIIECLRNNHAIIASIKDYYLKGYVISYTPISLAEIYAGIRTGEKKRVKTFFFTLNFIPIDEDIGIKAGEYLSQYSKSHNVEIADALVAAAAYVHKAELYTLNRKHYPMNTIKFIPRQEA